MTGTTNASAPATAGTDSAPVEPVTRTLDVPGATLTYDIRRGRTAADVSSGAAAGGGHTERVLLMIASPMGAAGFGSLSGYFTDRTVVTYDPRGSERSVKDDPTTPSTPEQHADDLHRIIAELHSGPVEMLASSGGAVNALALVARHPEDVRTLVAHEPPLAALVRDSVAALAATRAVHETYERRGWGAGMAHFFVVVSHRGPFPAEFAGQPGPDPAQFGMPGEDDGTRTDVMLGQNLISCTHYQPDFEALAAARTQIVAAAGAESEGELANRGAHAVAERLGTQAVIFPGDHGGFLGGEYGQTGDPAAFAAALRKVLDAG